MTLRSFHILFITLASLLCFLFAAWCFGILAPEGSRHPALGAGAVASGAALIGYGVWFLRKIRGSDGPAGRGAARALAVWLAVAAFDLREAAACSVCYGEADGPMIDGARLGVWLLFGLVAALQLSFASFFIVLWKRSRRHRLENPSTEKHAGSV